MVTTNTTQTITGIKTFSYISANTVRSGYTMADTLLNNPNWFQDETIGGSPTDYRTAIYGNGFKIEDVAGLDPNAPYYVGLQKKTGTLALTSDLATMVTTDTQQIVGARKYFNYTLGTNNEITTTLDTAGFDTNAGAALQKFDLDYTDQNGDKISTTIHNLSRPSHSQYYLDLGWSKETSGGDFLMNDIKIDSTGIILSKYTYTAATDTEVEDIVTFDNLKTTVDTVSSQTTETWTFTVDDGQGGTTTVTKTVVLG